MSEIAGWAAVVFLFLIWLRVAELIRLKSYATDIRNDLDSLRELLREVAAEVAQLTSIEHALSDLQSRAREHFPTQDEYEERRNR